MTTLPEGFRQKKKKMRTVEISKGWHKPTDKMAMSNAQYEYITKLDEQNPNLLNGWNFNSKTNAMRSLTKMDASDIIDALKSGCAVEIV
jgi:hypothetical protein